MYILLCHVLTETWTTQMNSTLKIQNFIMIRTSMMTFSNMYLLHILQQQPSPAAVRFTTSAGIVNTVFFRPAAPLSLKHTQQTVLAGKTTSRYFADTADTYTPHANNYTYTQTNMDSTRSTHTYRITQHDITGPAHHLLFQFLTPHQPQHRHRHRHKHTLLLLLFLTLLLLLSLLFLPPLMMTFLISL